MVRYSRVVRAACAAVAALLAPAVALAADAGAGAVTQAVDNPYGLDALWAQGDLVARGTLAILAVMSMWTWYILVTKVIEQSRLLRQARQTEKTFWTSASVDEGIKALSSGNPLREIAAVGVEAASHREGTLIEQIDLHTWISVSIQRSVDILAGRLQGGLAVLATVGSTAPFVGLFGTVWGIYHALTAIGIAGQASIDKVAGPVGEALIMTAIGLAVAVPAVLGYNFLVRRNKAALELVRAFASDLHAVLLSGSRVRAEAKARLATMARVA
jgi:biopolymer transport protein ExbB